MSKKKQLDIDAYRAELERLDDDQLLEEDLKELREAAKSPLIEEFIRDYLDKIEEMDLAKLREAAKSPLLEESVRHYSDEIDQMDLAELYTQVELKELRAAKVEKRLKERLRELEQSGQ